MGTKAVRTSSPSPTRSVHRGLGSTTGRSIAPSTRAGWPWSGSATSRPLGAPSVVTPTRRPRSASTRSRRRGLHALDDRAPRAQVAIQEVDVGAAPAALEVHDEPAAIVGEGDVGPRLLVRQIGEARCVGLWRVAEPVPPHGAVVARVVVVADGRRVRVARDAKPLLSGSQATDAARAWGRTSGSSVPVATSTIRNVERSSPPVDVPNATRSPSDDGSYQSIAEVAVPLASAGSIRIRPGPSTASASGRTTSAARSWPAHRSIVNRRSPRTEGSVAVPASVSSARRARSRPRAGMASRAVRVRSFWAVVQARTSSEEPSSNQRYGSATSMPCRVSTMSSTRVGGGGTSFRASARSCGRGWASGRGWPSSCGPGGWPSWCAST